MACTPCRKNSLEMPENQATFLLRPGHGLHTVSTNCLKMPENQAVFLPWPERVPDMACTPCPENVQKCLKIRLRPCHGHDASRTWPVHLVPEMLENQATSLPRPGCVPNMACTPCLETAQKCLKIRLRPCRVEESTHLGGTKAI
ncbi:Hypothetical predicted protein [Olea europaea subsp. europaea]|uniref:Uncharacterized protein n=1 Tax=Olea europaea subsp. europaea TaxID=158383 RepID=A0A8S0TCN5_OLEEU|nr:Hypothetical predicted protein [Olea europaea subsp. europaea]